MFVGARQNLGGMPFRAADQKGQIAAAAAPVLHPLRKLFRAVHFAATVQRNDVRGFGQGREHPRAFVCGGARGVAAFAAQAGLDFDQVQRQPVRQPFLVFGEPLRHPRGRAFADGDEAGFHGTALTGAALRPPVRSRAPRCRSTALR